MQINLNKLLGLVLALGGPAALAERYVATNGVDAGACDSWGTAAATIQYAINQAAPSERVLVSNGTYRVAAQITVTNGVILQSWLGREATIIDGNYPDTTNRCLFISNGVVDGFTVTNGHYRVNHAKDNKGGGIYLATGSVFNCLITGNTATNSGAGVYCLNGLLTNCHIIGNNAGATYTDSSSGGGGIFFAAGAIRDSLIALNQSYYGGGVFCLNAGVISNCMVSSNTANSGGGAYCKNGGKIVDSEIKWNTGGGAQAEGVTEPFAGRCDVSFNSGIGVSLSSSSQTGANLTVSYNTNGGHGGGMRITYNGVLQNAVIVSNVTTRSDRGGAGIYLNGAGTSLVANCRVLGNQSQYMGGGVYLLNGHTSLIWNCRIEGNEALTHNGGGVEVADTCVLTLRNCLIANNTADMGGGGVHFYPGGSTNNLLENCTIVSNRVKRTGSSTAGGCYFPQFTRIVNCVIYSNVTAYLYPDYYNYANCAYTNCCLGTALSGGSLAISSGNFTDDPQFVDWVASDYHLRPASPCVNAGIALDWLDGALDLDRRRRLRDGAVDLGVYELILSGSIFSIR